VVVSIDDREKRQTIAIDKNPLVDRHVCEAMISAIDTSAINQVIMKGLSTPSDQYVPASHTGHVDGASFRSMYPFDLNPNLVESPHKPRAIWG